MNRRTVQLEETSDDEPSPFQALFSSPTKDPIDVEIESYLLLKKATWENYSDPLSFWKDHEDTFPHIGRLARKILAIPASSAAVERLFSLLKRAFPDLRGSMSYETLSSLLNMHSIEQFLQNNS